MTFTELREVVVQNELAILEFIHCLVETLDRYFGNVCELDLMFNLEMVQPAPLPRHPLCIFALCIFAQRLLS